MNKPALFVGSSSEGLDLARAVRALLDEDAEVTLWKEGFFDVGGTFIDSLIKALPRFDFAALMLTADDLLTSREVTTGVRGCQSTFLVKSGPKSAVLPPKTVLH